jgi:hypothetical protein
MRRRRRTDNAPRRDMRGSECCQLAACSRVNDRPVTRTLGVACHSAIAKIWSLGE